MRGCESCFGWSGPSSGNYCLSTSFTDMVSIRLLGEVAVGRGATRFLFTGLIAGLSAILSEMFMLLVSGSHYL